VREVSALLATFGTLMRGEVGQRLAGVESSLEFISTCVIRGTLYDAGEYPALVEGEGEVEGELFRVQGAESWRKLDDYEGCYYEREGEASLFVRKIVRLVEPELDANVYFFNRPVTGLKVERWRR
jgi:gamma-glutamylcyclotransferase (GGCT)/AIG2-like uncharacterized protein YtfP